MRRTKEGLKLILIILLSALMLIVNSVTVQADTESSVTLNTNGGAILEGEISSYVEGTETILPTNIVKAGHTFLGWYENSDLTGDAIAKIDASATGEKTFYAKWQVNFNKMGYKQISAGMYQTLAIDESGNLWSWGLNNNGQVGNGAETDADVLTPTQIMPGTKFTQISAGNLFCLALDEDGNIWSFGTNGVGQLGVDGISSSNEPAKIVSETTFTKISAGSSHGLAIDINNKLWAWGLNSSGQLGNGTTNNSNVPVQIMSDISFSEITTGYNSSAAISTTGALYTWGANDEGELGDGTNEASSTPKNIETSKTFAKVQMSKGGNFTLAIDSEGKLYAWGNNKYGQLGNGTFENSNTPVEIMDGKTIKEITAGYNHALAIDEEGKLYAWGANGEGKLGTGNETLTNTPVQISADKIFKKVSAGWNHTVAIGTNGFLYVWGGNTSGELGTGNNTGSKTPIALAEKEIIKYSVTLNTNKGLIQSGNITEYEEGVGATLPTDIVRPGYNFLGWFENENLTGTPVTVISEEETGNKTYYASWQIDYSKRGFIKVSGSAHSLAIDVDGNLWAWGLNSNGQLGNNGEGNATVTMNSVAYKIQTIPVQIKVGTKFKEISAGGSHSLALDEDGNLWAWGANDDGQIGDGTNTDKTIPVQIKVGTKFKEISAGGSHSLAIDEDGNLWAWGYNFYSQLGDGTQSHRNAPIRIKSGTKFKEISAGTTHSLAIDENGNLWAWGYNTYGEIGDGTRNRRASPIQIKSGTKFKEISAGGQYSLAIDIEGNLWAWGLNNNGQLGNGGAGNATGLFDFVIQTIPVQIKVGTKFKEISGSLAIDEEGNLWAWGPNYYGQVGDGTTTNRTTPVQIKVGTKFKEISAGSLAIDEDGNLWAWGYNTYGQVGDGSTTDRHTPVQISDRAIIKFNLSLNLNGGEIEGGAPTTYNFGETTILPIPTKLGYTFAGWYDNAEFTGEAITQINDDQAGDRTYYAKWEVATNIPYKIEHYKQTDTGYELVTEDVETLQGTTGEKVSATPKTYEGYIWNKYANGTVQKGEIQPDGSLVLKLYYDKLVETNFNISITNKSAEDSEGVANSKYDITVEYCDGTTQEFKDKVTDENGNITLSNVAGKNIMKVYFKQTAVAGGFNSDTSKKYVEIKINSENSKIELTGAKTAGIIASTDENTLYITQFNNKLNYENSIRIHAVDNIDNEIGLSNIPFTVTYPDGREKQLVTDEEGIAEISNLPAPGVGDFIYEIKQLSTLNGYIENKTVKYVNITFDENGIITKVEPLSDKISANKETENIDSIQNVIANINIEQTRDTENGQNGIFSDYSLHIIERDKDTNEYIEGVTYKIIEKATTAGLSNVATVTKKTNSVGQINTDVVNGQEVVLTIKRTKVPNEYKLLKEEIKVKLTKNADGQYELQEPVEGVTIDNEAKTITVNRQLYKTTSIHNVARTKVNNEIFITKVDEDLRPLQGVVLELRENTSGTKWELKTDDNGLAKLTNEDIVNSLGSEFPQYLKEGKGKLTFWITEKTVPVGYERIEEDIGFEAYYETTPDGTLEISYMNVLDGLSYYHIVNQEYDQYEKEDYMQVDINLKVINPYADTVDKATLNTLKIEKVDSKNENTKLENATFQITLTYPTLGKLRTIETTNRDGIASIGNLYFPEGTSTIEIIEKSAPYGYILDTTPTIIKVTNTSGVITVEGATIDSNRTINVKLTNTHKQYAVPFNIVVNKRNKNTNELIDSTAEFKIEVTKGGTTSTYNKYTGKRKNKYYKLKWNRKYRNISTRNRCTI